VSEEEKAERKRKFEAAVDARIKKHEEEKAKAEAEMKAKEEAERKAAEEKKRKEDDDWIGVFGF
jgi:hypothetical protein